MPAVSIERRAIHNLCKELGITRKQLKKRRILKNYKLFGDKYILQQMNYKENKENNT